jgi:hypothetical protein
MEKDIQRYGGHDLLENKIRGLRNKIIELEFRKKDLNNIIVLQRAQLSDLAVTTKTGKKKQTVT